MKVNIGSGNAGDLQGEGWVNLDVIPGKGVDVVADCTEMPFPDDSVEMIRSYHMIEHLTKPELNAFARECLRVLAPGGRIEIVAPAMERALKVYHECRDQESIEVENFPISPQDWIDNFLFARHLHGTDYHKQGIYRSKLERVFRRFTLHHFQDQDRDCSRWEIKMECEKAVEPFCSVVLSTRDKAESLQYTLDSIFRQIVPFPYEVIVVDDGSTDETAEVCRNYALKYIFLDNPRYRNPSVARNMGYRAARGKIILAQSDDIIHVSQNAIEWMCHNLDQGEFLLAKTENWKYDSGKPKKYVMEYCGPKTQRPYFFLGTLWRKDLYAVGGCDEEFVEPCFDDNWFADCLLKGLKLRVRYTDKVLGHHQSHAHGKDTHVKEYLSRDLYAAKVKEAEQTGLYQASGGPWKADGQPITPRVIESIRTTQLMPTDEGRIPKTMNFFWAGSTVSFMRYLTLRSFRRFHPDWRIVLYHMQHTGGKKLWPSSETQDTQTYDGPNYWNEMMELGVKIKQWIPPDKNYAPAHACDFCQWKLLAENGGFYSDMDVLFTRSIPYQTIQEQDAVFCFSQGFVAIGLFASSPGCNLFRRILRTAQENYAPDRYQSTGAEAIYRLAGVWPNWGQQDQPGTKAYEILRGRYPAIKMKMLPDETFYPWTYRQTECIFSETRRVPKGCVGIHWFGGNNLAQEWNNRLTHENIHQYQNTFSIYAQQVLRG